jgi:hypothetical protein
MSKTFKHSGDLGDITFALPVIRAMGGGVLYLDPEGGLNSPTVKFVNKSRTKLDAKSIDMLIPILKQQPYVEDVRHWHGEPVDHDLDEFRNFLGFNNLSDSHLAAFGLPTSERDAAWIQIADPIAIPDRPIVVNRSIRYHGNYTFWEANLPHLSPKCIFVGYPKDYEIFLYTFGHEIPYYPTPELLTLARVIAGCQLFMGNQGFPHALAEGMKKNLVNEVFQHRPAAIFKREGAHYV